MKAFSARSPALRWAPGDEEMNACSPCPSNRPKHLLGSPQKCFPKENPGGQLLMIVFSVNTVIKLFKYCDNMANEQRDNFSPELRKVHELFVCA